MSQPSRPVLIVVAGAAVIALAIGLSIWVKQQDKPAPPPAANAGKASPEQTNKPSFDVVRINPQGETVIAGRGMPRAEIVILDGGKEIGRTIADNRGEWVFVPDKPLPPGTRETDAAGQQSRRQQEPDRQSGRAGGAGAHELAAVRPWR